MTPYLFRDKHFGAIIAAVMETMKQVGVRLEELQQQYNEMLSKIREAIDAVYPQLKESYNKIFHEFVNLLDTVANVAIAYFKAILDIINEHQEDLKELAVMVSELVHDVVGIVFKSASQIRKDVEEFIKLLINQMKALPISEFAKEKYQEYLNYRPPAAIIASVEEFGNAMKAILPTQELQDFFEAVHEYMMKNLKNEPVGSSLSPFPISLDRPYVALVISSRVKISRASNPPE